MRSVTMNYPGCGGPRFAGPRFPVPDTGRADGAGLLAAPKLQDGALCYLRLKTDGQSLVSVRDGAARETAICDVRGLYPVLPFTLEMAKLRFNYDPREKDPAGIPYTERLLRSLQWDVVGQTLILGFADIGWFLFREEEGAYRYVSSLCGTFRIGASGGDFDYADSALRDLRVEKYFIRSADRIRFAGCRNDARWTFFDLDLNEMRVSAFYPLGRCCDVQYLPDRDRFLLFLCASDRVRRRDEEEAHFVWNGRIAVCDGNGQTLHALRFDPRECRDWAPDAPQAGAGDISVWSTNDEVPGADLYTLDTRTGLLAHTCFGDGENVYYDAETNKAVILHREDGLLRICEADAGLRLTTPCAELETDTAPARIRYLGRSTEGMALLIDRAVFVLTPEGLAPVAAGEPYAAYEPGRAEQSAFRYIDLFFGEFYGTVRLVEDSRTGNLISVEPLRYPELLPAELFRPDGLPDAGRIRGWLEENRIPRRTYEISEEISALVYGRRARTLAETDRSLPPERSFWLGAPDWPETEYDDSDDEWED